MDARRVLGIKVGSVRRLAADERSYVKEMASYEALLRSAEVGGDALEVKRHRQFVEECGATMRDIHLRLVDAVQQLQGHLHLNTQLVGTDDWEKAQRILNDTAALLQPKDGDTQPGIALPSHSPSPPTSTSTSTSASIPSSSPPPPSGSFASSFASPSPPPPPHRFSVAVYGGSQVKAGDEAFDYAVQLGQALAEADFHIVSQHSPPKPHRSSRWQPLPAPPLTAFLVLPLCCVIGQVSGGYGGVMEAVSAGGRRVPGASVEGILSPAAFPEQGEGNGHLTCRTLTNDLPHRVVAFLSRCQAFVVLPGGLGTLTELCLTWNVSAVTDLQPEGRRRPLCLLAQRRPWEAVIDSARALLPISDAFLEHVRYVDNIPGTIQRLKEERSRFQEDTQQRTAAGDEAKEGKEERA